MMKFAAACFIFLFFACGSSNQAQNQKVDALRFDSLIQAMPNAQVLDVRTAEEFHGGYILRAINMDINGDTFQEETSRLKKQEPVLVYCLSGGRSHTAAKLLRDQGYEVIELEDGIASWKSKNLPVEGRNSQRKSSLDRIQFMAGLDSNVLHLVDFNAKWCLPCRILLPIADSLDQAYEGLQRQKMDYDKYESLAREFQVEGIPYLLLIKNGVVVWTHFGLPSTDELIKAIEANL